MTTDGAEEDHETAAYRHLKEGFSSLPVTGDFDPSKNPQHKPDLTLSLPENRSVLVHFLDPAAVTSISSRAADGKIQTQQQQRQSLNEKFSSIFQNVYHNRLSNVPFQDARSKTQSTIPFVNVNCHFLESQVDLLQTHEDDMNSEEGGDDSATNAWHTRPYCFVYFVTGCETLEDYRTKVKPAIQVFLSQLNDLCLRQAMQLSAGSDDDAAPSYLLVYCPMRKPGTPPILPDQDGEGTPNSSQRFSLANRLRQRINRDSITSSPLDAATPEGASAASTPGTAGSTSTPASTDTATPPPASDAAVDFNPLQVLTKVEKEVARRLAMDFPQGTVATLTTLGNDYSSNLGNQNLMGALEELEKNEWAALLAALSKSVIHGFEGISNRLLRALRKISNQKKEDQGNLGHYFLIKESLAFTYEQMNLPAEALLQYNELRAFLPALHETLQSMYSHDPGQDVLEGISGVGERKKADLEKSVQVWDLKEIKSTPFRKSVQGLHYDEYYQMAPATEMYLWLRETSLLFQTGDSVEALKRSLRSCTVLWEYYKKVQYEEDNSNDMTRLEEWAFVFCWDLTRAAQSYLVQLGSRTARSKLLGRELSDIIVFARSRLHALAATKQEYLDGGIGNGRRSKFPDISKSLDSWSPPTQEEPLLQPATSATEADENGLDSSGMIFLKKAFSSKEIFQAQYINAMKVCISLCGISGRHRLAARFTMELVDLYVEDENQLEASRVLQSVTQIYARSGWNSFDFLGHFRSAGVQRKLASRIYLANLVNCFSRQNNLIAPPKARELLCQDFESVTTYLSSLPAGDREVAYYNSPIFEAVFKPTPVANRKSSLQRKVLRKVFTVGQQLKHLLLLTSHFSHAMEGCRITVSLVPYKAFAAMQKSKKPMDPKNICNSISLPDPLTIVPGENEIEFEWSPMVAGQFVLSQVTLEYKSTKFVYTCDKMKEVGFWLDVTEPDPTQSLQMRPLFLIPGHQQVLHVEFFSGDDHVVGGELNLVCSPGLVLLPSEEDEAGGEKWLTSWNCPLGECLKGQSRRFSVTVRGVVQSSDESEATNVVVPTVHAKVSTTFRCAPSDMSQFTREDQTTSIHVDFKNEIESVVPSLVDSTLTIENVSLNPYDDRKVMASIATRCHVPAPFKLKKWSLGLPSYLEAGDDINKNVFDATIVKGETINFVFDCVASAAGGDQKEQSRLVAELQDEDGVDFKEEIVTRMKKSAVLPSTALPNGVYKLGVRLDSNNNWIAGTPSQLTYTVDLKAFTSWGGEILYSLETKNEMWLVTGKTKGVVSLAGATEWKLCFDAIPTCTGATTRMPLVAFEFLGGGLGVPYRITLPFIEQVSPTNALLPSKHSTVAFLMH